ncbi:MAG: anhydro-N-acetylmuramic acid kinase [Candidatus Latescibacteria bacterium]|jgi:anhydro-N-acetylmuramic acid kinase|nr:anhydro-N-acetylmuramic acid kinase [Gemmatimonadaceae bacterium]MDP6018089.1 anhydro-N-acetylmuramic acid kinase [Candidatus Latescibacterota bacterium]MDP7448068.1 anhydro-N-acetylmuramic acid kinase [Candidatus Latescibacterota bacterium]HJP33820.1 anhydro-N-acetylmuramic acid kinase [Candidatus Latescibacterota bacterium]
MKRLIDVASSPSRRIVGLMTGTSADGIDAVLAEIDGFGETTEFHVLAQLTHKLPESLQADLFMLFQPDALVEDLCRTNFALGAALADAALQVVEAGNMVPEEVDLIGSHGQTVRHLPQGNPPSTLQIGEAAVIARHTGIPVISDFRPADMAAGGEGAPLVPLVDVLLFGHPDNGRLLLNIGGIANVTAIPAGATPHHGVLAFDLGPGNALVDAAVQHLTGGTERYDDDGRRAAGGTASEEWVEKLLKHDFFRRPPPKSTGREEFGTFFVAELMHQADLAPADLLATLTLFTARSIAVGIEHFADSAGEMEEVFVGGGGVHNSHLMALLEEVLSPRRVRPIDDLGVRADAKEALAFAVLANETVMGRAGNVRGATGATMDAVLGKISLPPLSEEGPH